MSKPSYLFGTMHVKDRRVFNFSDSVMLSLQNCQRFALEVHPDTLMKKMFATLQNQDSLRSIDKLLGKEDYEKMAKKFKDKNGYEMGKTDPMLLEHLMKPDDNKPDDKVSFVDAYLYGIARTLNKGILGLEDAASQFDQYYGSKEAVKERLLELLDDDITDAKIDRTEEMIKIYSTGNLNGVYKYITDQGGPDSTIIARNRVMASSMIKYMADGPLFTAVGCAHLPGPDGVIALLQKEGYTVTRVEANFTGTADKYHIDYMKMDWPAYRDENHGFSVNFPGTPMTFKQSGINTIIYPDLAYETYYGVYAVPRGTPGAPPNRAQVIAKLLDNIKHNKKNVLISKKDIVFNKMPSTEIVAKTGKTYLRLRFFVENSTLYAIYAGATLNKLNQPYINRYFNSFAIIPIALKTPASWITYNNPVAAFTVKLPGQPQVIAQDVPSKISNQDVNFKINMYLSVDSANSKMYLVRYNDYPGGTFLSDKSAIFDEIEKQFNGKGKVIGQPQKVSIEGYDAREFTVILTGGFYSKIRVFARGNRMYMLLKEITQPDLKEDSKDAFFDSFKLTPYVEPEYYNFHPDGSNYRVQMVAAPKPLHDSVDVKDYSDFLQNTRTYYSTNPNSGGLFGFEHSTISPYLRITNIDSLYKKIADKTVDYQDTLLKVDTITLDGVKGRDLLTQKKGSIDKKRTRLLIKGDDLFCFIGRMDNSELFDKTSETFYGSLKVDSSIAKNNLAASKAGMIFRDLSSTDSTTFKLAAGALSYYDFAADELPLIYAGLQKSYPDDTAFNSARTRLIRQLKTLHNDSTVNVLVRLYQNLKADDGLKATILNAIPVIDSKNGYNVYLKLLTTDAPTNVKKAAEAFQPLTDSIEFAAAHFEQLLPLIKNDGYRNYILRIARLMGNSKDAAYDKLLKDNYSGLMAYAKSDIDKYLSLRDSSDNPWGGSVYNYMQLISKIKNGEQNNGLTNSYLEKDPKGLYAPDAIVARINNNLPNNPLLVNKYLDSIGTRYDLMEAFNNQNQLSRVPLKYRAPAEYAKLCLYQYVSTDDYGSPEKLTLLGSVLQNGSVYYAFKFLLPNDDDDVKKEYIALTGPYKPGATKLSFKKYYAYTEYKTVKVNWRAQATKMIKPLIDAYSEEK